MKRKKTSRVIISRSVGIRVKNVPKSIRGRTLERNIPSGIKGINITKHTFGNKTFVTVKQKKRMGR